MTPLNGMLYFVRLAAVCHSAQIFTSDSLFLLWQVWEVAAQLTGLALSILLLNAIDATGDPTNAVWAWVGIQSVHVGLRYKSLSVIQLPTLNQKRSCALVSAFVRGQKLPGGLSRWILSRGPSQPDLPTKRESNRSCAHVHKATRRTVCILCATCLNGNAPQAQQEFLVSQRLERTCRDDSKPFSGLQM